MLWTEQSISESLTGLEIPKRLNVPTCGGTRGCHPADLFATAPDAGIGLVVADQEIAGLIAIRSDMPDAIPHSTGWQIILLHGSQADRPEFVSVRAPPSSTRCYGRS